MRDTPVPLRCDEALSRLEAAVDGELDGAAAADLERHLADCPGCAAEMERARTVREALRDLPLLDPPTGLTRAVLVAAAARRSPSRPLLGLAAAAVLALLAGALWLGRGGGGAPEPSHAEIRRATREVRLALAVVGRANRAAAGLVRTEAIHRGLAAPSLTALHRLLPPTPDSSSATPPASASPAPTNPVRSRT